MITPWHLQQAERAARPRYKRMVPPHHDSEPPDNTRVPPKRMTQNTATTSTLSSTGIHTPVTQQQSLPCVALTRQQNLPKVPLTCWQTRPRGAPTSPLRKHPLNRRPLGQSHYGTSGPTTRLTTRPSSKQRSFQRPRNSSRSFTLFISTAWRGWVIYPFAEAEALLPTKPLIKKSPTFSRSPIGGVLLSQ